MNSNKTSKLFILILVLASGFGLIAFFGFAGYKSYKIDRYTDFGDHSLEDNKLSDALYWYSKTLELDEQNLHAVKQMARILDSAEDQTAIYWWREWVNLESDSDEARLGLAKNFIRHSQFNKAQQLLSSFLPGPEDRAQYYNLQTAIDLVNGDLQKAEASTRKALIDEPDSVDHQINLLTIILRGNDPARTDEVNSLLNKLSADEKNLPRVWRTLLDHSIVMKNYDMALVLTTRLHEAGEATPKDTFKHVRLLLGMDMDPLPAFLKTIDPANQFLVENIRNLLLKSGATDICFNWLDSIKAPEVVNQPLFQVGYAECLAAKEAWNELFDYLENKQWQRLDYYRYALLAKAHKINNNENAAHQNWSKAVELSRRPIQEQQRLAIIMSSWEDFKAEKIELLETLMSEGVYTEWSYLELYQLYYEQSETFQLYRISEEAFKIAPHNDEIANNSVMFGLLLDRQPEELLKRAENLYSKFPGKIVPASTYAFALYKNGQPKEAFELMRSLPDEFQNIAEIAYYTSIFAYASGEKELADELYAKSAEASLLPEERELIKKYR